LCPAEELGGAGASGSRQRFCNALPPVPAHTAPYRLVPKIRHLVAILPTVHPAESHRVAASSVGNPVGNMPILAWETCHKSMVLTAYRAFDDAFVCYLPRGQPSQRHNPGNPPRLANTKRYKRETQKAMVTFWKTCGPPSISAGRDGVTDLELRPRLRCHRRERRSTGPHQTATAARLAELPHEEDCSYVIAADRGAGHFVGTETAATHPGICWAEQCPDSRLSAQLRLDGRFGRRQPLTASISLARCLGTAKPAPTSDTPI